MVARPRASRSPLVILPSLARRRNVRLLIPVIASAASRLMVSMGCAPLLIRILRGKRVGLPASLCAALGVKPYALTWRRAVRPKGLTEPERQPNGRDNLCFSAEN
ncbi:MAG: hypothetical protein M0Q87_11210 [Ottowia sp.]|nr:hypothetical protein [Ottowia sp.]